MTSGCFSVKPRAWYWLSASSRSCMRRAGLASSFGADIDAAVALWLR